MESIRVIMLRNWHFDILNYDHWEIAWDLWANSWVISEAKEWAFVLIIISFIPLWFTGWIALSLVSWGKLFVFIITLPWKIFKNLFYKPVKIITTTAGVTPIRRKKSYKEIRPRAVKTAFNDRMELSQPAFAPSTPMQMGGMDMGMPPLAPVMAPPRSDRPMPPRMDAPPSQQKGFDHALFKFDDTFEDLDFDIDSFEVEPKKPREESTRNERPPRNFNEFDEEPRSFEPRPNRDRDDRNDRNRDRDRDRNKDRNRDRDDRNDRPRDRDDRGDRNRDRDDRNDRNRDRRDVPASAAPMASAQRQPTGSAQDIIQQKGYEVISRISIKNTLIDYIAVSANKICLCMLDREPGDWLADEERFNDEEPLWFSESSHRISPVRKIDIAKQTLLNKLDEMDLDFKVDAFVIVQIGNIINAEDMFEIWDDLRVNVTRIDRGTPKEIKLFARAIPDADKRISPPKLEKITNLIRNLS